MSGPGGGAEVVKVCGCTRPLPLSVLFHSPDIDIGKERRYCVCVCVF